MTLMVDWALAYAEHGWAVFPLNGKIPCISKNAGGPGVHGATTDPAKIKKFCSIGVYPDY